MSRAAKRSKAPRRAPSANGEIGRSSNGRFAAGNTASRGNPFMGMVQQMRGQVLKALARPTVMPRVINNLVRIATDDDPDPKAKLAAVAASKELLNRGLGKPEAALTVTVNEDDKRPLTYPVLIEKWLAAGWPIENMPPMMKAFYENHIKAEQEEQQKVLAAKPALTSATPR